MDGLLPEEYLDRMRRLLKEEYDAFYRSYAEEKAQGLRINTLKISVDDFMKLNPFHLEKIPWAEEGFYYTSDLVGKHPYHESGLYYIQEPSAMAAAVLLNPQPGERVLDICAAPGGKAGHIAARLQGKGLLIANEIQISRAKILSQNIERMGIRNCIVTNESPERLSGYFQNYFHRILVDAPCSGEGMFRKNPETRKEWSLKNVFSCAERQIHILETASDMLMAGGTLVYSTCTFSPEENEGVIEKFLRNHPEFEIQKLHAYEKFSSGKSEWIQGGRKELNHTVRIWPHRVKGEGHFIAVLKKKEEKTKKAAECQFYKYASAKEVNDFSNFAEESLHRLPEGRFLLLGEQLYIVPEGFKIPRKLKILRVGLHLGTMKKNRFEPSHSLAMSLKKEDAQNWIDFSGDSEEVLTYLKGETIEADIKKGWVLVCVEGYSLGWGKSAGNILKNHYPKGLRWRKGI